MKITDNRTATEPFKFKLGGYYFRTSNRKVYLCVQGNREFNNYGRLATLVLVNISSGIQYGATVPTAVDGWEEVNAEIIITNKT